MLRGDAWIVKKIQHVSFAQNALRKVIMKDIEFNLREMLEGAVIVEIQRLGIRKVFAQIIKVNMILIQKRSWNKCLLQ